MSGDELTPPDDGQPFDPYYTDVEPSAAAGGVWANRRVRNGLIAAGVVAAAVVVIGINDGNSGGAGSALRSQEPSAVTTTTIRDADDDEDDEDLATVTRSLDDVTTPGGPVTYDELSEDEFTDDEFFSDDEFTDDTLFDDGFFDDDEFADDDEFFDDFFSDDDDDFFSDDDFFRPSTGNRNRLAPRVPFVPRTTTTVAAATTTEPPEETTTTVADTTTTVADTTTTASTTTTVPVPAPAWTPVTQGLTCSNPLTLWARGSTVLAGSQDDELFALSGDQWSVATGIVAGRVRAVVADPTEPTVRWVAGSNGVFRLDGQADPAEIGDLADVISLTISPDGTLLAATTTALHRWNGLGPWNPVTPPLATGETLQALHVHDGDTDTAFLGTSLGVRESDDGGLTWEPVPNLPSGVVGEPVFSNGTLSWLRTGGQGVLQWTADPAVWTFDDDAGATIPETAASLAVLADGHLLTVGAGKLVVSGDGAAWTDFGPALPANYPTAGVVRHGTATFVWASDCRTDVVLRLTDQPA